MSQETFTEFGSNFQDKLVYALILDRVFSEQILEIIDGNFFDSKYHKDIVSIIQEHYSKYKSAPTINTIESLVASIQDKVSKEQAKLFMHALRELTERGKIEDLDFVKDKSIDFCKKQNLKKALFKAAEMLKYSKFDEIVDVIKKSILLGSNKDIGILYSNDIEERYKIENNKIIPTPWSQINKIMNGGLASRELHIIMAPVTRGKSHILVQIGAYAALLGYNVIHYTLELSDKKTALRYDSCLSKIPYNDLMQFKDVVKEKLSTLKGQVIIKEYSTKTASSQTIRNHLSKIRMKGIEPDLIIVDYADLMKSVSYSEVKRFELESIAEDLRAIGGDYDVPIVTATQSTRSSADSEFITLEAISESYLKAAVCDFLLSFSRKIEDFALGTGKFFIAKNRSGISGLILNVHMDTSISTITIIDDEPSIPNIKQNDKRKLLIDNMRKT